MNLANNVYKIFRDIRPGLIKIARDLKFQNVSDVVDEWMSKAYIIALAFDKNSLQRKVWINKGDGREMAVFDPSIHSYDLFEDAFKSYLKTCFRNDLVRSLKRSRKSCQITPDVMEYMESIAVPVNDGSEHGIESAVFLDDLQSLVRADILALSQKKRVTDEEINIKFLISFNSVLEDIERECGNIGVARCVHEKDNDSFFMPDFRTPLPNLIIKKLCHLAIEEKNPFIVNGLAGLIFSKENYAIKKKICRYLYEYQGGYPERLRASPKYMST